jgi:hypothetical protein
MADALQHLLHELEEPVVIDGLGELDDSEVALALSCFAAGFALLVEGADAHAQVVEAAFGREAIIVELGVREFNNCPTILPYPTILQSTPCSGA